MKAKTIVANMLESQKAAVLALYNEASEQTDAQAKMLLEDIMDRSGEFGALSKEKMTKIVVRLEAELND